MANNTKSTRRGKNFSAAEVTILLDLVEEIRPTGNNQWDTLYDKWTTYFSDTDRTTNGLRKKFKTLYYSKIPTGDPNCPADVKRAKRIIKGRNAEQEISDGEGSYDDEEDGNGEDDSAVVDSIRPSKRTNSFNTPMVSKRSKKNDDNSENNTFEKMMEMMIMKSEQTKELLMMQYQHEAKVREEERKAEKERRDEEREERRVQLQQQNQMNQMMQLMMMRMMGNMTESNQETSETATKSNSGTDK